MVLKESVWCVGWVLHLHVRVLGEEGAEHGEGAAHDAQHVAPAEVAGPGPVDASTATVVLHEAGTQAERENQQSGDQDQHCKDNGSKSHKLTKLS